jgi:hypothetical protein
MAYAENTTVPLEKSIGDIVALVKKAGAERIARFEEPDRFTVQFELGGRMVRFRVRLPQPDEFTKRGARPANDAEQRQSAESRARQRARALLLVIKAKLESVESEVETFEEAFLPNIVMSDGATVYERVAEPIALEYRDPTPRPLLLSGPSAPSDGGVSR